MGKIKCDKVEVEVNMGKPDCTLNAYQAPTKLHIEI